MSVTSRSLSLRTDGGGLIAVALLSAAVWPLGVAPLLAAQSDASTRDALVQARQDELAAREEEVSRARESLERARTAATGAGIVLESPLRLNHRIALLTTLAEQAGLRLDGVRPGQPQSAGVYGVTRIIIEGRGDAPSFQAFLNLVHEKCPDIVVERFDFASESVSPQYTARAAATLVWCTQPPAIAGANAAEVAR